MSEKTAENMEFVETVVNVRYAETDQMGVVYYANYLTRTVTSAPVNCLQPARQRT